MVVGKQHKSPAASPMHKKTPAKSPPHSAGAPSPAKEDLIPGDELTALLIQIKTEHPEYGFKRVHDKIHEMGGNYARVNIKRVQRYLHKLGLGTAADHPGHEHDTPVRSSSEEVDSDELIALIKAIKFAHPEFGVKRVHAQILTHGGKFTHVSTKRVKKFMRKLGFKTVAADGEDDDDDDSDSEGSPTKTPVSNVLKRTKIQLMTIGGESKSERIFESSTSNQDEEGKTTQQSWLPVKLDEPASKMQEFPYQAVIRMTTSEEGEAQGSMGEIYKIQVAVEADGSLSTIHPMLVYNKPRNRKTFLHPDSPAYLPVQRLIANQGLQGTVGGSKAYFWGRYFQVEDMLYINTDKLAPFQQW
uniref:HTH-like domain-containing protein n=1 Tax=Globisporangium ultimum (strain ATCC 200006 / CBS 805.95 / DAOM BR144) TaxID=431595 RepID=K3WHQ8_GLOUD